MRVADAESLSQRFETIVGHFVDVSNESVRNGSNATEGAVDSAIYLSPEGADEVGFVEVLNHSDFWARSVRDIFTVGFPGHRALVFALTGLDHDGGGVANHGAHLRHKVPCFLEIEGVARGVGLCDLFPAIVDRWGIPALELLQI